MSWADSENGYEMIRFINPDKRLAVTLAITLAWEALPVFEEKYPKDDRPRKAIELSWRWLSGEEVCVGELRKAADAAYAAAYAANAAASHAAYAASHAAAAAYAAAYAASNAAKAAAASRVFSTEKNHIANLIRSLVPLMIDYAIENQVPLFNGSYFEFDDFYGSLSEVDREKVFYNLELFGE